MIGSTLNKMVPASVSGSFALESIVPPCLNRGTRYEEKLKTSILLPRSSNLSLCLFHDRHCNIRPRPRMAMDQAPSRIRDLQGGVPQVLVDSFLELPEGKN